MRKRGTLREGGGCFLFPTFVCIIVACVLQELPEGESWTLETGKKFMQEMASNTQKANEKVEQVKATLKAREV